MGLFIQNDIFLLVKDNLCTKSVTENEVVGQYQGSGNNKCLLHHTLLCVKV